MELKYVKSFIVIKLSFVFLLSGISLLFSGCATFITKSSSHSSFSGQFSCPSYKGNDNEWNSSIDTVEHKVVNGVDIIVVDHQGDLFDKTGPYTKTVMVADGKWRYAPLYRNNTIYPVKLKTEINGSKLKWQAEYPELIDNKGQKRFATSGKGMVWIDQNGDKITTGSHYTGQIKCKRLK